MRSFKNGRVKICLAGGSSNLLTLFSERLSETEFTIEFCEKKDLTRADLVCLALTKKGIQVCEEIQADPFLLHISILFIAAEDTSVEMLIEGFDAGGIHIITAPFLFGALFSARFRSLVSLSRSRSDLVHMASTDYLTNLSSRRFLFERLKGIFLNYESSGLKSIGCLMIDIDHLKIVNDSRGHSAGDKALVDVADLIRQAVFSAGMLASQPDPSTPNSKGAVSRSSMRSDYIVARIGGDEIAAVLPDIDMPNLLVLAEHIRKEVDCNVVVVTTSIGLSITSFPIKCSEENVDWFIDDLIVRADRALYKAKEGGRNRVAAS